MPRVHTWFTIPAGRSTRRCKVCGGVLYWITTEAGARLPADLAHAKSVAPTDTTDGRGQAHVASCPARDNDRSPQPSASHAYGAS